MLKLAFRNIFRNRMRTMLTLGAINLGVIGLILSGGFVQDVYVQLRESTIHSQLGHIQVCRTGYFDLGRSNPSAYLIERPDALKQQLETIPDVKEMMARVGFSGLINNGRADLPIIGEGIEPEREARLGTQLQLLSGRALTGEDQFAVVIGEGVARTLGLVTGDYVNLLVTTPDGALNALEFEVVGVFRTFSQDYDSRAVRVPLAAASELLNTSGVHSLVFLLNDTAATNAVAARVAALLEPQGFEVRRWDELADFYQKTVEMYRRQFGVLQLIILSMVLLSVANSVNMGIYERTGEFGTLMALGTRRQSLRRLIMLENALLGLLGAASGVVLAVVLAIAISDIGLPMPPPPNSNIGYRAVVRIVPEVVATAFAVGAGATVLAALLPAWRVTRIPVAEALRDNA